MERLICNITSYLHYLNQECKLNVSVHFSGDALYRLPEYALVNLLAYNSHQNPYCMAVKSSRHMLCRQSQNDIRKSCKKGEGFCRTCHAGVSEYIFPICMKSEVIGFAAASGYRKCSDPANIIDNKLWSEYLSEEDIPITLCETLLPPLCMMIEYLFTTFTTDLKSEFNLLLQFLNEYHNSVTIEDICKYFHRSKSHISHMFKKKSGVSIREYCNKLNLNDAQKLLLTTERTITEIALDVGFHDTSYFIALFKKNFGISPLKYRKAYKTTPPT